MSLTPLALCFFMALGLTLIPTASPAGSHLPPVLRHRYTNGLTVLVRENPTAPVVAVSLQVQMGTRWERPETAGISNLLQHVLVKGTRQRSAQEIVEAAEGIGGGVSASGETDFSEIRGTALARHWKSLLDLIADVALRPSLPPDEIENERRVILSQIRNRGDLPFPLTFDTLLASLYGSHPYAFPAVGQRQAVERIDRAALLDHYRRYYRANRIVLAVSGQVSGPAVVEEVGRVFADLPGEPEAREAMLPAPAAATARQVLERAAAQAQILIGYLAPSLSHPDYPAVKVLSTLLGGGMAGRLFSELRDKQGLAYSVGALYPSRRDTSFFVIHMGTAPENLLRGEEGIMREVERIRREPATDNELSRAKAYLLGNLALDRRTNARQAWYLAFFELAGVGHEFLDRYLKDVEAVSVEDISRVAGAYLATPTVTVLKPVPK
ncbi:MAG: insulinase family protein [Candidatus Rokubacteria bacterium]|nr:insulinase family protein [Candidatus Rokubacteria bacterium]